MTADTPITPCSGFVLPRDVVCRLMALVPDPRPPGPPQTIECKLSLVGPADRGPFRVRRIRFPREPGMLNQEAPSSNPHAREGKERTHE